MASCRLAQCRAAIVIPVIFIALALAPMSSQASSIHQLLEEVAEASKNLPSDVFQDDAARKRLQEAAAALSGALESPIDGVRRLIFQVSA